MYADLYIFMHYLQFLYNFGKQAENIIQVKGFIPIFLIYLLFFYFAKIELSID